MVNLLPMPRRIYKTIADLLGADRFTDVDKFATRDYGAGSIEEQNDLNHPNRRVGVGDKFGYNYNIYVNKARAWMQFLHVSGPFAFNVGGHVEGTQMD